MDLTIRDLDTHTCPFFLYTADILLCKTQPTLSITNEIVKFIAGIELDPKDKEVFTKGLKDANDRCDALRKSIVDQQKELLKLAAAGKEGSKAYQDLEASLKANRDALKGSQEMANKYASALGVNQMSMNQLKAYTKKLRNEMNSLHKESDPDSGC